VSCAAVAPADPRLSSVPVVIGTTGTLESRASAGVTAAQLTAGQAYTRPAGVEHDVVNANAFEFVFVEIELKS